MGWGSGRRGAPSRRVSIEAVWTRLPAGAGGGQTAKKAPPKRKGPLDKFLLGQLESLKEERETYTRQAESLRAEADSLVAEREPGDVQFDEESGDANTVAVERDRDLALSAQALSAVEEINAALERIEAGTYGICTASGEPMPNLRGSTTIGAELESVILGQIQAAEEEGGEGSRWRN